jgi:hypothetical protein
MILQVPVIFMNNMDEVHNTVIRDGVWTTKYEAFRTRLRFIYAAHTAEIDRCVANSRERFDNEQLETVFNGENELRRQVGLPEKPMPDVPVQPITLPPRQFAASFTRDQVTEMIGQALHDAAVTHQSEVERLRAEIHILQDQLATNHLNRGNTVAPITSRALTLPMSRSDLTAYRSAPSPSSVSSASSSIPCNQLKCIKPPSSPRTPPSDAESSGFIENTIVEDEEDDCMIIEATASVNITSPITHPFPTATAASVFTSIEANKVEENDDVIIRHKRRRTNIVTDDDDEADKYIGLPTPTVEETSNLEEFTDLDDMYACINQN